MRIASVIAVAAVLAVASAGHTRAVTNEYIDCLVDVQYSTGKLALELSAAVWDLGQVPRGGVKDTWFGKTTHGAFWVRNAGDTNAAVFIAAEAPYGIPTPPTGTIYPDTVVPPYPDKFAMAVATNVEALLPDWKVLDQWYRTDRAGRFMRVLVPGDYMLFDLRFYAGSSLPEGSDRLFRVGIYATGGENP